MFIFDMFADIDNFLDSDCNCSAIESDVESQYTRTQTRSRRVRGHMNPIQSVRMRNSNNSNNSSNDNNWIQSMPPLQSIQYPLATIEEHLSQDECHQNHNHDHVDSIENFFLSNNHAIDNFNSNSTNINANIGTNGNNNVATRFQIKGYPLELDDGSINANGNGHHQCGYRFSRHNDDQSNSRRIRHRNKRKNRKNRSKQSRSETNSTSLRLKEVVVPNDFKPNENAYGNGHSNICNDHNDNCKINGHNNYHSNNQTNDEDDDETIFTLTDLDSNCDHFDNATRSQHFRIDGHGQSQPQRYQASTDNYEHTTPAAPAKKRRKLLHRS